MISENLVALRKKYHLTQEEVAEQIGVSRISVAKWERGESMPDMNNCIALASLYEVSLDTLVNYSDEGEGPGIPPKGKYFFGAVTVGERGQVVIPKKAREIFSIEPGDKLLLFGDEEKGIGILPEKAVHGLLKIISTPMFRHGGNEDE